MFIADLKKIGLYYERSQKYPHIFGSHSRVISTLDIH